MYSLTIRDYLKCAHSLKGDIFGPAQLMHVITYEVEVTYTTPSLDEYGIIVDFASAQEALQNLMSTMNFKNLDEHPELNGVNTTTEFLCKFIHDKVCESMRGKFEGDVKIVLRESPVAWTAYDAPISG